MDWGERPLDCRRSADYNLDYGYAMLFDLKYVQVMKSISESKYFLLNFYAITCKTNIDFIIGNKYSYTNYLVHSSTKHHSYNKINQMTFITVI